MEKRTGKSGPYFLCHQCKKIIPEDKNGNPQEPISICGICGGLIFEYLLKNGEKVVSCWTKEKHKD